jgi:PHS family inorganic phosphate transporter-like MFS transporter
MDRFGHRRLQLAGFIMMAAWFAVIGLVPGMTTAVAPFLIAYGISYFFTEFGPNVTTFVLPARWLQAAGKEQAPGPAGRLFRQCPGGQGM